MKENYHILYTSDKNYFPHMLTSIYSLLENNREAPIMIHIIYSGFGSEEEKRLEDLVKLYPNSNIQLYNISKISKIMSKFNIPKWNGVDIPNARLFFHEVIPNISKVLYLDCDTTIVSSLDELFQMEIETPIAAVKEPNIPQHIRENTSLTSYYNSGVLFFNTTLFEKERCPEKIYHFMKENHMNLVYPDQDILNLALPSGIQALSMKYNVNPLIYHLKRYSNMTKKMYRRNPNIYKDFYPLGDILKDLETPHILHNLEYYCTRVWQQNRVHPFNRDYDKYRLMWDEDYKKDTNPNLISHLCFVPFLNAVMKAYLSKNVHDKMKSLVKRKYHME